MSLDDIEALTFDTGGTILDWHGGFSAALAEPNPAHDIIVDGFPDLAAALGVTV